MIDKMVDFLEERFLFFWEKKWLVAGLLATVLLAGFVQWVHRANETFGFSFEDLYYLLGPVLATAFALWASEVRGTKLAASITILLAGWGIVRFGLFLLNRGLIFQPFQFAAMQLAV